MALISQGHRNLLLPATSLAVYCIRQRKISIAALSASRQNLRMSNRLSRDTEDAAKVLAALRDQYHPRETLKERLSAAADLRAKLINVAAGVRQWSVKVSGEDTLITLNQAGTVRVHTDPETGQIQLSADETTFHDPGLQYDPVSHEWLGREVDLEVLVPHGERRPKKAALVALTEQIVRLLEKPASSE